MNTNYNISDITEEQKFSLYHLERIYLSIQEGLSAFIQFENLDLAILKSFDSITILGMSSSFILIKVCTFFEEYNRHFKKLFKNDYDVIKEIDMIKQVIDHRWPDIDNFRNEVSAHPFREPLGSRNPDHYKSIFREGISSPSY
jgi:hypothetical protein